MTKKDLTYNKVVYIIALVNEFAKKHNLTDSQSFKYLKTFDAIRFIDEEYDIAHTLSFADMVDNLGIYCKKKGGKL